MRISLDTKILFNNDNNNNNNLFMYRIMMTLTYSPYGTTALEEL